MADDKKKRPAVGNATGEGARAKKSERAAAKAAVSPFVIPAGHAWSKLWLLFVGVAVVGLVLAGVGFGTDPKRFAFSYLTAFFYGLTVCLGALFFVILQHLTGSGWSVIVRRGAEQLAGVLPLFALLFVPIVLFHHDLYPWAGEAAHEPAVAAKSGYLNTTFWLVRAFVYFAIWAFYSWQFLAISRRQDATGDPELTLKMQRMAPVAMLLFGFTLTFGGVDWVMSLTPQWYSTIFGVYLFAGAVISIYAFLSLLFSLMVRAGLLAHEINREHFHDLGKMLFAFTIFWAYIGFSQYMLIWYANIPEETSFYQPRQANGWGAVSIFLILGHFFFPFFLLLSRNTKRFNPTLIVGAVWVLFVHYVDMYWLVMPNYAKSFGVNLLADLGCLLLVVGATLAVMFYRMAQAPIAPLRDPRLDRSLGFENA